MLKTLVLLVNRLVDGFLFDKCRYKNVIQPKQGLSVLSHPETKL